MYKIARNRTGLSIEVAAEKVHVATRTLCKIEAEDHIHEPAVALEMSRAYKAPEIVTHFCRRDCAIGQALAYEVLDHVDKSLPGVILKLASKMRASDAALSKIMYLAVNKTGQQDFSPEEWGDFDDAIQVFLDLEHNIGVLKEVLWKITDVSVLVAEHNRKCMDRGYCGDKKTAALQAAI
jgi:DNA-binding XRE family transcriptional regulator